MGAGASRLVTGNHPLLGELETRLARLKNTAASCVFGSGYLANVGIIPALVGPGDLILIDELSHACLWAGARLSRAAVVPFRHADVGHVGVLLAELDFDLILARRNPARAYRALPVFPSIRRDVAMLVPEITTHEAVLQVVKTAKPANLEAVELFDVFRGKHVPEGQKSLAYAFTYRSAERTLTDVEVAAAHDKLVAQFKQQLQAVVRE